MSSRRRTRRVLMVAVFAFAGAACVRGQDPTVPIPSEVRTTATPSPAQTASAVDSPPAKVVPDATPRNDR